MKIIEPSAKIIEYDLQKLSILQRIEWCGRKCYKSEDKITEESANIFVPNVIKQEHNSVLEMARFHVLISSSDYSDLMGDIESNKYKFLEYSFVEIDEGYEQLLISGSPRAFRDSISNSDGHSHIGAILKVKHPILFSFEIEYDKNLHYLNNNVLIVDDEFIRDNFSKDIQERHIYICVDFVLNRAITQQLLRHREISPLSESQRYCLSGDTKLTFFNKHIKSKTIRDFYERSIKTKNNQWKRSRIRQLDERTGEIIYQTVKVIEYMGVKETIKINTKLGYSITLTKDHKIFTINGYKEAKDIVIGDLLYVNGSENRYKNKIWLFEQYVNNEKTAVDIANEEGVSPSTIKKWLRKFDMNQEMKSNWQLGRKRGKFKEKYNIGNPKDGYKAGYREHKKSSCEVCKGSKFLHGHHIDEDKENFDEDNILTLCPSCHSGIHNKTLEYAIADEVISIEDSGKTDVYDIAMNGKFHNFIANGIVVHNCNYSLGKFENSVKFIKPLQYDVESVEYSLWKTACQDSEDTYFGLLENSAPQAARSVLNNSVACNFIVYASIKEWKYIFKLRGYGGADPEIKKVMIPLEQEFIKKGII